ncbi:TauD/TfdA family dioxygenase [Streptomyces sp. CB01881]|uniref:TauD/TfdA family dioxygenase n=1 Tax=Streptomyces sp. CB01881 TaxID=2078691 RepID=UPI0019D657E6|nr:TauD/TfdA family dioxygenase [Streptomyces sp. CB01881]
MSLHADSLVSAEPLLPTTATPLLLRATVEGVNLRAWTEENREAIRGHLLKHGAVLFRGFSGLREVSDFEHVISCIGGGDLLRYSYASTPRTQVSGGVYTSTEYPADQEIPLHNEMAYARQWPMKLGFYSVTAAQEGGETPLADSRRIFQRIPADIRDRFVSRNVMYVRNYGEGLDLSWQEVFDTTEQSAVEEFCHRSGIEFEWKRGGGLRTRQVCQAALAHPVTGDQVWFNQAHLFHVSSLAENVRSSLLAAFAEEDLPRNAYYGDGSPIDPADLETIRQVLREEEIAFPWQSGDIAVVENMLVAHGRRPFKGPRRVVVGMAEPFDGPSV